MSRISFTSRYDGLRVEVVAGWDRSLQCFFMTIFNLDVTDEDDDEIIWDDSQDYDFSVLRSTDKLQEKLASLYIEAPKGFWNRVELKEGNSTFDFGGYSK